MVVGLLFLGVEPLLTPSPPRVGQSRPGRNLPENRPKHSSRHPHLILLYAFLGWPFGHPGAWKPLKSAASAAVSALSDPVVGEAVAYVQGESLKAPANLADLRFFQLPDLQGDWENDISSDWRYFGIECFCGWVRGQELRGHL